MQTRDLIQIEKPYKGLHQDTSFSNQPEGTYYYGLNLNIDSNEGDLNSINNEIGNELCYNIEINEILIGTINIGNNEFILFIADENQNYSKISLLNSKCEVSNLILSTCLNFNKLYPIQGIYRVINGCERKIYFTDNYNPIRSINIDSLDQYTPKNINGNFNITSSQRIQNANNNDLWECGLFKLSSDYIVPEINLDVILEEEGNLDVGSYIFTIRYIDKDGNKTNWSPLSEKINLSDIAFADSGFHLNNNYGGNVDSIEIKKTNQTIKLDISYLDIRYERYEIGVIQYSESFGTITEVYTLPSYSLKTFQDYVYFTGAEIRTYITSDEILIPNQVFDRVKALEQIDNRLILANTSNSYKDWSVFQQYASKIKIEWTSKSIPKMHKNINYQEDSSTAYYSIDHMGFQRDEIYALGIVYVFRDGSESPVFHIPGRASDIFEDTNQNVIVQAKSYPHNRTPIPANPIDNPLGLWDKFILTVVDNGQITNINTQVELNNVLHIPEREFNNWIGDRVGSTIEMWKVFNTAIKYPDINSERPFKGELAYYEGQIDYPELYDCNGNSIWGTDFYGNDLIGTPIRHHKMPDIQLLEIDDKKPLDNFVKDSIIRPLGLIASNIHIPNEYKDQIQHFYIVRVERDDATSSVLDVGYLGDSNWVAADNGAPYLPERHVISYMYSGDGFNTGDVEKDNTVHTFSSPRILFRKDLRPDGYLKIESLIESFSTSTRKEVVSYSLPNSLDSFRPIESYLYMDENSFQLSHPSYPFAIKNGSVNIHTFSMILEEVVTQLQSNEYYECTIKQWVRPYEDIFNLNYVRCKNDRVFSVYEGTSTNPLSDIEVWGGDVFISEFTGRTIGEGFTGGLNSSYENLGRVFENFYSSSIINSELRMIGNEPWKTHWRSYGGIAQDFLDEPNIERSTLNCPDCVGSYSLDYIKENKDLSYINKLQLYFPLKETFDYCNECIEKFPNRIFFSEKSIRDDAVDNYKIFKVNNNSGTNLSSDAGDITCLFKYRDQLYLQTQFATWFIPSKPQVMQTNEGTVSVGNGDFLSIPPQKLETVSRGYAGNQSPLSLTVTEYGVIWADIDAGKVFLLSKGLQEISMRGMKRWFENNLSLDSNITNLIPNLKNESVCFKNGVGVITTYDPKFNRLILHKKDYNIIDSSSLEVINTEYIEDVELGYNLTTGEYYRYDLGGSVSIIDIYNRTDLFEDKSWTISYSFVTNSWVSFHSYMPNVLFSNRDTFFSHVDVSYSVSKKGYIHNKGEYGKIYESIKDSCIHLIFNKQINQIKVFNSLQLLINYYNTKNVLISDIFDKYYLHTEQQSSGLLIGQYKNNQDPFLSVRSNNNEILVQNNESLYNFSYFYDLTVDYNENNFSENWIDIEYKNNRINHGYIYYPNSNKNDYNKSIFQKSPFRDKWIGLMLIYNNTDNFKFNLDLNSLSYNVSYK